MARSSSGPGRRPLKAEITGSTPVRATLFLRSVLLMFAYILRSTKDGTYYYGSTKDLECRLMEHNNGKVKYTKGHRHYKLHYFEEFATRKEAFNRERFFKTIDGYNWLKEKGII